MYTDMAASLSKGGQYRKQSTIILIIGTPIKVLLFLESPLYKSKLAFQGVLMRPVFRMPVFSFHLSVMALESKVLKCGKGFSTTDHGFSADPSEFRI